MLIIATIEYYFSARHLPLETFSQTVFTSHPLAYGPPTDEVENEGEDGVDSGPPLFVFGSFSTFPKLPF